MEINTAMLLQCLGGNFVVDDDFFHNWLMVSVLICYGIAAIFWISNFVVTSHRNAYTINTFLVMAALFSMFAAITDLHGTKLENSMTFFFQSISKCLLLLSLLWTSSGHEITRSARDVSVNQFLAVGACVLYASFDIFAISGQVGYPVVQIVYPVLFVGFSVWILANAIMAKRTAGDNKPRQLFFEHFIEAFVIYIFCIAGLFITNYLGCYFDWPQGNYAITQATQTGVTFLLTGALMVMLRPARMALIVFNTTEYIDEKKTLVDAMYDDVSIQSIEA